jgi:hypothetical protein
VTERVANGQQVVIAKIHCEDSRVFDAVQRNELESSRLTSARPKNSPADRPTFAKPVRADGRKRSGGAPGRRPAPIIGAAGPINPYRR